jgi:signal transduction histidine kinase
MLPRLQMSVKDWTRGLYLRIALGFMALITLVLLAQAIGYVWLFRSLNSVSSDDLHQQALTWTRAIAADLGQGLESSDTLDVTQRLAQIDVTRRVFVIFRDGRIVGSPPPNVVRTVTADFAMVPERGPMPISWEQSPYAAALVLAHGKAVAAVGITPRSSLERFGPLIGAAAILSLIGTTLLFAFAVVRPVSTRLLQLQAAAKKLEEGELDTRVAIGGYDEVAEVAHAFNAMADELERRTTAAETSDRLRRQLVADVSHELMTPLTAVLGHLETLSMDEVRLDDAERRKQLAIAMREARRLKRVIGDLLDAARHEAGGVELNCEEISTMDLFEQVIARHAHECRARRVTVEAEVASEAATFEADPFRIEQAIDNVMVNALRHAAEGGRISLRADRREANVVIEICDSGQGIPPEHLPYIFDRFYKASTATGIASPGSGLGLSIVKAIVNRHGGQVSATSEPGIGTIIRMELPAVATTPEPQTTL